MSDDIQFSWSIWRWCGGSSEEVGPLYRSREEAETAAEKLPKTGPFGWEYSYRVSENND